MITYGSVGSIPHESPRLPRTGQRSFGSSQGHCPCARVLTNFLASAMISLRISLRIKIRCLGIKAIIEKFVADDEMLRM